MIDFTGKVALVTGAARGLGEAIARQLCELGAAVVLTDVLVDEGEKTAAGLRLDGYKATFMKLDVASESEWQAVVSGTVKVYQRLDFLVNNAGINIPLSIEDATVEQFQNILNVNLVGAFIGMKAVIPVLKQQGQGGAIVNIASNSTRKVLALTSMYSASKAALANLTKSTAIHLAETGTDIRVNSVHPGAHATHMILGLDDGGAGAEAIKMLVQSNPMKRLGKPEEVATTVAFLLSDAASHITAQEVFIDGGISAL